MPWIDDPFSNHFDPQDAEETRRLEQRPKCSECGKHIQERKAFYIYGEWICIECMKREYLRIVSTDL